MTIAARVAGALALQPMTVAQLARCLCASQSAVRNALADNVRTTRYRTRPRRRSNGAPPYVYQVRS